MEHRHLWLRSPRQAAVLRVRAEIIKAARDFFDERGFTLTDPPILTPAACEGTTTLFPVDYFDEQAFLTQSGQLYIEATAMALGKVYSFGPTFRAEKSKTRRHLTEFWMVEPEVAYATLDDLMKLAEEFITFIVKRVLEKPASGVGDHRPRHQQAGEDRYAVPAHHLRRSREDAAGSPRQGPGRKQVRVRRRFRLAGRDLHLVAVRPAGNGSSLSGGGEGVLHGARSRSGRTWRCAWTCSRRRVMARSSAARSVWRPTSCCSSAFTSTACRKRRSSGISTCASTAACRTPGFGMGIERAVAWICGLEHVRETIPFARMLHRLYP